MPSDVRWDPQIVRDRVLGIDMYIAILPWVSSDCGTGWELRWFGK
jgi:hypothetical protein